MLTGDIVVWIDTDVTSAHPKFVYGIVGPLLLRPDLHFVKAFYQRPLHIGDELQATGGGRVTELTPSNPAFPHIVASAVGIHDQLVTLLDRATTAL